MSGVSARPVSAGWNVNWTGVPANGWSGDLVITGSAGSTDSRSWVAWVLVPPASSAATDRS